MTGRKLKRHAQTTLTLLCIPSQQHDYHAQTACRGQARLRTRSTAQTSRSSVRAPCRSACRCPAPEGRRGSATPSTTSAHVAAPSTAPTKYASRQPCSRRRGWGENRCQHSMWPRHVCAPTRCSSIQPWQKEQQLQARSFSRRMCTQSTFRLSRQLCQINRAACHSACKP